MSGSTIESRFTSPAATPLTPDVPTISRRRLVQGAAALGLSAIATRVFSVPQAAEANPSQDLIVELPTETPFLMGPGNIRVPGATRTEFGAYAILPQGTPIELNGVYGDFIRGKATYEKKKDGKTENVTKNGYIYKGDIPSVPDGLKELTIEQVPWVKTPMVGKEGMEIEAGKTDLTQLTPYYKTLDDTDVKVNLKVSSEGTIADNDFVGVVISNPGSDGNALNFLNVVKENGYWTLNYQQGDQWGEIAQFAPGDDPNALESSLRITEDGSLVTITQGDSSTDPIALPAAFFTGSRILDVYGINTPADGSLKIDRLDILTPPSGKYVEEK